MKNLIIHIGDYKTGTSSIQQTLMHTKNQKYLSQKSIVYCKSGIVRNAQHHLANQILYPEKFLGNNDVWAMLAKEIVESQHQNHIVSTENFENVDPEHLKTTIKKYIPQVNIKIILYVRPHISRLVSSYSQVTKKGRCQISLDDYLKRKIAAGKMLYKPRIIKWQKAFDDKIIMRPFAKSQLFNANVVEDFLVYAFKDQDIKLNTKNNIKFIETNIAPSYKLIEIMDLHSNLLKEENGIIEQRIVLNLLHLSLISNYPKDEKKPYINPLLLEELKIFHHDDAKYIDENYCNNQPIFTQALEKGEGISTDNTPIISDTEKTIHLAYATFIHKLLQHLEMQKSSQNQRKTSKT